MWLAPASVKNMKSIALMPGDGCDCMGQSLSQRLDVLAIFQLFQRLLRQRPVAKRGAHNAAGQHPAERVTKRGRGTQEKRR
jgi:hypothetical protein